MNRLWDSVDLQGKPEVTGVLWEEVGGWQSVVTGRCYLVPWHSLYPNVLSQACLDSL